MKKSIILSILSIVPLAQAISDIRTSGVDEQVAQMVPRRFQSLSKEPVLDPTAQSFLASLTAKGGKPLYELAPDKARLVLDQLQSGPVNLLEADIEDITIPYKPDDIDIRIVRPKGATGQLPVVIYIHGGGWVLGNENTHDRLIREIANGAQAAVVFVKYTPAPEGHYPTAHNQGYVAAKWIEKEGGKLNLDTSRMAIAGDSVGGLMATAIAMMAVQFGGPRFLFQVLFYPATNAAFDTPSYEKFAKGYYLDRDAMKWFWDMYVPNKTERQDPLVSPLTASLEKLSALPPAMIMTNEADVLRDEGEAYAHKLIAAGVPTIAFRVLGLTHDSVMLNALADVPGVRFTINAANNILKEVFKKAV